MVGPTQVNHQIIQAKQSTHFNALRLMTKTRRDTCRSARDSICGTRRVAAFRNIGEWLRQQGQAGTIRKRDARGCHLGGRRSREVPLERWESFADVVVASRNSQLGTEVVA
jgi:hypothetical protein